MIFWLQVPEVHASVPAIVEVGLILIRKNSQTVAVNYSKAGSWLRVLFPGFLSRPQISLLNADFSLDSRLHLDIPLSEINFRTMNFTHNAFIFIFIFMTTVQNQNFSHNRIITFWKFISNYLQDFSLSVFHNSTLHPDSPMFLNLSHNAIRWVSYFIQRYK